MKRWSGGFLAVLLTAILLLVYYTPFILQADHLAFCPWGDGYKNYYTLAYYLQYDNGVHFTGMNYPFGEHIVFTDNQPIIAWLLKPIVHIFPSFINHIHAFIALAIFAGILLTAFVVYLILKEFAISEPHAPLFATLIALLSPQIQRMHTHFSLSYPCFVPLLLYLTVRLFKTNGGMKYYILIILLMTFFTFIHVYYLAIAGLFLLLIASLHFLVHVKQLKDHWQFPTLLASAALVPLSAFKLFMYLTDSITDRPQNPWGFVMNRSTMADIFLHPSSFTGETISRLFPHAAIVYHFEGTGYIGLVCDIALAVLFVVVVKRWCKKENYLNPFYPFSYLLPASGVVLLFAMAFPFSIDPIEKYYELLPFSVKQFRAAGRFNWIFYYTATIFSAIFIYRFFTSLLSKNKTLAYLLILSVYVLWFVDVNMVSTKYFKFIKANMELIHVEEDKGNLKAALSRAGKKTTDFQAIFPLPFFVTGSERIGIESSVAYDVMKTSFSIGLPIATGMLSRTSEQQTFQLARLISDDLMKKDILQLYKNRKPLLLVYNGQELKPQEQKILARSTYLFEANNAQFYELPLTAFNDVQDSIKKNYSKNKRHYYNHADYTSSDSITRSVLLRYEHQTLNYAEFGKGALNTENKPSGIYFDKIPNARDKEPYEISLWVYADERRSAFCDVLVGQVDQQGNELTKFKLEPKYGCNVFGKWMRVDVSFTLENSNNKILIAGSGDFGTYDEVLIRAKNETIISDRRNDTTFMYNNFPIR